MGSRLKTMTHGCQCFSDHFIDIGAIMWLNVQCIPGNMHMFCSLRWRHNGRDGVSNHQPHDCLLNRLLRRRSKKTSKFRVTGLCVGIHRGPVNSPHKWPVTRKMFPFDDVIMFCFVLLWLYYQYLVNSDDVFTHRYCSCLINCQWYNSTGYG